MNNIEFVEKLKDVEANFKTLYVMGCFGAPMTAANKKRYCTNHSYNKKAVRTKMIQQASTDTFGFDCVNLIKGVLWGWKGQTDKPYGGASYASNNVPDLSADQMITKCSNISTDFSKIEVGEAVWMRGHIGVYIGDGLAIECTPKWENRVQVTSCNRTIKGYKRRNWTKHGKLPYIDYAGKQTDTETKPKVDYIYEKGDKGEEIKRIQETLVELGYDIGEHGVDGSFGGATRRAVEAFQKANGLEQTGAIDKKTLDAMNKADEAVYTLEEFIRDVQKALGVEVDGRAGSETLSKTITISSNENKKHPVVKAIQKRLYALGYTEVGKADGSAGPKFTAAVKHFQQDHGRSVDGEITAKQISWKKLLGMA